MMCAIFELEGQQFYVLNGGPVYTFSPAISLFINCTTQEEVDHYWEELSAGGEKMRCGWLTDKFGVTWQVAPTMLNDLLADDDAAKANRVMQAMMRMEKLDIGEIEKAAKG